MILYIILSLLHLSMRVAVKHIGIELMNKLPLHPWNIFKLHFMRELKDFFLVLLYNIAELALIWDYIQELECRIFFAASDDLLIFKILLLFIHICVRQNKNLRNAHIFQVMSDHFRIPWEFSINLETTLPLIYNKIPLLFPMAQLTLLIHIKRQTLVGLFFFSH